MVYDDVNNTYRKMEPEDNGNLYEIHEENPKPRDLDREAMGPDPNEFEEPRDASKKGDYYEV